MVHQEVFKLFNLYFPNYSGENAEAWFANGENSIRVRLRNKQELIFTIKETPTGNLKRSKAFSIVRKEKNDE